MADHARDVHEAIRQLAGAPEPSLFHPPADPATVELVNVALLNAGYPRLPADYDTLLTLACGVQGPYCTRLGPGGLPLAGGAVQPGIHQESVAFNAGIAGAGKVLVLGRVSGDAVLVFSDGAYRLVDVHSRDELRAYETILAFIADMIALKSAAG